MRKTTGFGVLVAALALVAVAAAAAPGNDAFPGTVLAGASGAQIGTTAEATAEPAEPGLGGVSVWYTWQAPSSDTYSFCATPGIASNIPDTLLGAYSGEAVDALTQVAFNDDGSWYSRGSFISFSATAGVTYRIGVGGYSGSAGPFALTWKTSECQPPSTTITNVRSRGRRFQVWFQGDDNITPAAALTFECALDNRAFAPCTSPVSYSPGRGSHTIAVRATDGAGNTEPFPDSITRTLHGPAA